MPTPPLIAHVINRLDYGGLENGLVNLINGLPTELCRHAVVCLSGYSSFAERIKAPNVEIVSVDKKAGKDFPSYARAWRLLKKLKPRVVHTRNIGTLDYAPLAAAAGVATRIHGLHGWDVTDLHGTSRKYRALFRVCDFAIDRYVAVSRDLGEWLSRTVRVDSRKISQIYNGVNTDRFRPRVVPRVFPADFLPASSAAKPLVLCSVGRLAAVKNHELLVRAFAALTKVIASRTDAPRLVVVGDGELRQKLHALADELGVRDLCWFTGAREDVNDILAAADVFVLPSLNEGISNTILEAMATGKPVVATRVGGNAELVADGVTGYLVPSGDIDSLVAALRAYHASPDLVLRHGEAGRRLACERFSMAAMLAEYQRLYQAAFEKHLS